MSDIESYRQALLTRLAELDQRLHQIETELDEPGSKDWGEMAIEREGDEVLESLGHSGQIEIARIRAALQRMREGIYGVCTHCDEQISAERLSVLPDTPLCKSCATLV